MNYRLNSSPDVKKEKKGFASAARNLFDLMHGEGKALVASSIAIVINSGLSLLGPFLVGYAIDHYVTKGNLRETLIFSGILFVVYAVAFVANFAQMRIMGAVGQRVVFNLRDRIFRKLQELPIRFFNQNKAGDLISRINNDTDLLNQFFAQSLTRFVGMFFTIAGSGIAIVVINYRLGTAALVPAVVLWTITFAIGGWLKARNKRSLQSIGGMSAEIQESLNNFKVIVAFNRRDYFKEKFEEANNNTFKANMSANIGNSVVTPMYDFAANVAQLVVLAYGIMLIAQGNLSIGLLVSFLSYAERFYNPLRQLATLWTSFQLSLAAWDRVQEVLSLESDLLIIPSETVGDAGNLLEFRKVSFRYDDAGGDEYVLKDIDFKLERRLTYALVGPTGGGKTTTASLMARLFDPTEGVVYLDGRDIRSFAAEERVRKIGFILQEPFLFGGTVRDNILYGIDGEVDLAGFSHLLSGFEKGLDEEVKGSGEGMSLGQKQIIAFIRAVVRKPELLILDEATANIDTVTEELLQDIIRKLPKETTKVIIAHRLNTIENADHIFFVNGAHITSAGSFDQAVEMLLHNKRQS